jgi:hypothetical protein
MKTPNNEKAKTQGKHSKRKKQEEMKKPNQKKRKKNQPKKELMKQVKIKGTPTNENEKIKKK